ncbi:MAG: ABC transporter ATP-binding protein [Bacteroidetes bacterium]|nr:MAG: ABC transporter ATP-binding protein [Bacteroidota bacterium]
MIEVVGLNKSFSGKQVLTDINAVFEAGKSSLIIGASGSGKTTLIKCIVGLHTPETGKILFDGRDFLSLNEKQKKEIRKEIGFLFQGAALFDSLNVEENVKFPLRMLSNMTEKEMQKRVDFCLERVNLPNVNHLMPSELSGGMKKRVGIARAISMNPKYLFCDEPNSGLDPQTSVIIDRLIHEITQEYNITTLVVTHDMNSVLEIGDHILFVYKGRIKWRGNSEEILRASDPHLNDFVYASDFMKKIKDRLASG